MNPGSQGRRRVESRLQALESAGILGYESGMANKEELAQTLKLLAQHWRIGLLDDVYTSYRDLFSRSDFAEHRPEDQRSAIAQMIKAKGALIIPRRPTMIEAYRAALAPLKQLVSNHGEPADYELLGICHAVLGKRIQAGAAFEAGLEIEQKRNPQSELCRSLAKWNDEV